MSLYLKKLSAVLLCTLLCLFVRADVRLPAFISDHMVLQQNTVVKLWGWSDPGETIKIKTGWDTTTFTATGSALARWSIDLNTHAAGGPFTIRISANNSIEITDVLIGEVWLCSGQSNMEMSVNWGLPYASEAAKATNTALRFFQVAKTTAAWPQEDVKGKWVVCTPEEMKKFSAVGYFFGKRLNEELQSPVGLINASWSGSPAEVWTPVSIVEKDSILKNAADRLTPSKWWPHQPALSYNAMIHPFTSFVIEGVIWYQGESNVGAHKTYDKLLTCMIGSWRNAWKRNFPFYLVQIAPYSGYGPGNASALLREAQQRVTAYPNTGMVATTDLVDDLKDIHPKMKKEVGERLANYALGHHYKRPAIIYKSPSYQKMEVEKNGIRIYFNDAPNGFVSKEANPADFEIAGADKVFLPANTKIEGNTIRVWNDKIKEPVAVRFGFNNTAQPRLFSREGLPVLTFRSDSW